MTPERCTGLAALLLELRDWLEANGRAGLDLHVIEYLVELLAEVRRELMAGGAR